MQTQNIDVLISEANQLLNTAEAELQRSQEDVITHMICHNSKQSIKNYLASFLIKNGVELQQPATMMSLMAQCRTIDGRFDLIDISQIQCRHEDGDDAYCLNVKKVTECLQIAKQTKGIAINETPGY